MINRKILYCFVFFLPLVGCNDTNVNIAKEKVQEFHVKYNEKEFDVIYDAILSKEFKESMNRDNGVPFMSNVYDIFGGYQNSELKKLT